MKNVLNSSLTTILWLTCVVVAIFEIVLVRGGVLLLYGWIVSRGGTELKSLYGNYWSSVFIGQILTIVLSIGVLGLAVGVGEYQAKHGGDQRLWRLFAWIFGIEALIFIVMYPLL